MAQHRTKVAVLPAENVAAAPAGRRERKKAQLRQQIVDTAMAMFRERGYEATRIEDINESLDISRTTFFRYFPSKDAVLRDYIFDFRIAVLKAELAGDAPVAERLRNFYLAVARAFQDDLPVVRATVLTGSVNPVRSLSFRELYRKQFNLLLALFAEGQQRGEITKDFTPWQLATFVESLNNSVISLWAAGILAPDELLPQTGTALEFFLRRARP